MSWRRLSFDITLGVLILGCLYQLAFHPPYVLLLFLSATGKSQCPLYDTLVSQSGVERMTRTKERMVAASHLIQQDGAIQLWDTPRGRYWIPGTDTHLSSFTGLVLAEQENHNYGTGEHAVRRGDVVLDCGADVGMFTRTALDAGASLVVAVEPMPLKEPCLRRTFAAEIAAGRVIVCPKGVWNKEAFLKLYGDSIVEKRVDDGPVVPLTTIDNLVNELKLNRVDFIKMDIEGAEKAALEGGQNVIRKFHPRLAIATEHLADDVEKIPVVIRGIEPSYRSACGRCEFTYGSIRPQIMNFF